MTALRGFTLNSHSYETDENVIPVESVPQSYHCPAGHTVTIRFAADAEEIPHEWDCPKCGRLAHLDATSARQAAELGLGEALVSPRTSATGKTHWDMLLERRTVDDLEKILAERLALLRADTA
jgi:predicted RNA-binding Zn-ribbon protein involved in translation (DUF1610 family)